MKLTHVIVFHDKSKLITSEEDYNIYLDGKKKGNKGQIINGSAYSFSSYAKFLSLLDFYYQYPAERPIEIPNFFSVGMGDYKPSVDEIIKNHHDPEMAIKGIIEGLEGYIASDKHQGTQGPIDLLAKMKAKLVTA